MKALRDYAVKMKGPGTMYAPPTDVLAHFLAEVMRRTCPDRDYSGEVGPHTRFFADLGMASIDAVVLAEQIGRHYGRKLPFGPLLLEVATAPWPHMLWFNPETIDVPGMILINSAASRPLSDMFSTMP